MHLRGLIARGKSYYKVNVKNIDHRQTVVNDWFDDVLKFLKSTYHNSFFYATIEERLINMSGYESMSMINPIYDRREISVMEELEFKVKDYGYRLEKIINELENICED